MTSLIFWIIVFYFIFKNVKNKMTSPYVLLNKLLIVQQFSNVSNVYSTSTLSIIRADKSGENYIFSVKKDGSLFSIKDIEKVYAISQNLHTHNIVLAVKEPIANTNSIYRKIKEYNIEVWTLQKLLALSTEMESANSTHKYSVLKTSDVSDDTCKIEKSSFDPIQDQTLKTHSLLSGIFDKPDHL